MRSRPVWAAAVAAAVLAFAVLLLARGGGAAPADLERLVADGAVLVDVRTPEEYAAGHLAGAVNIPLGELSPRAGELGAKDRPVVLYCRSGRRSAQAAELLRDLGFTAVHDAGAMKDWARARPRD